MHSRFIGLGLVCVLSYVVNGGMPLSRYLLRSPLSSDESSEKISFDVFPWLYLAKVSRSGGILSNKLAGALRWADLKPPSSSPCCHGDREDGDGLLALELHGVRARTDKSFTYVCACGAAMLIYGVPKRRLFGPVLPMANGATPCSSVLARVASSSLTGGSTTSTWEIPSTSPQVACSPVVVLAPRL